ETALPAGRKERSLRGDVHDVGVARVDDDLADVLGLLEPHALPRLASVDRLVDAVTEVGGPLRVVLARAEPEDVGVLRIDDDAAAVEGAAVVEDRRPRDAAVDRLPHAAERRRDVIDVA